MAISCMGELYLYTQLIRLSCAIDYVGWRQVSVQDERMRPVGMNKELRHMVRQGPWMCSVHFQERSKGRKMKQKEVLGDSSWEEKEFSSQPVQTQKYRRDTIKSFSKSLAWQRHVFSSPCFTLHYHFAYLASSTVEKNFIKIKLYN